MTDFKSALEIAKNHFGENKTVTKLYDAPDVWVAFAMRKDGAMHVGSSGIKIDKVTGKISRFILPSDENFALLDSAQMIEIKEDE